MRKTVSVPGDLSLLPPLFPFAQDSYHRRPATTNVPRPASSQGAHLPVPPQWTTMTDADYEAELARQQQKCQEEVAARLDFTDSLLMTPRQAIPHNGVG